MTQVQEAQPVAAASQARITERVTNLFAQGKDVLMARKEQAMAIVAIGVASLAIAACGEKQEPSVTDGEAAATATPENCGKITLANTATLNYRDGKFLPRSQDVGDNKEAATYTKSLFGEDGPLAGKADAGSLAIMNALVTEPLTTTDTNNDSAAVRTTFRRNLNALRDPETADDTAEELCKANYAALAQTVGFEDAAIAKGEEYIVYRAVSNKEGEIVGYRPQQHTAQETFPAITYRFQNASEENAKGKKGINEVFVRNDGTIITKGTLPVDGEQEGEEGKGGEQPDDKKAKSGSGRQKQQAEGGSSSRDGDNNGNRTGNQNNQSGGGNRQSNGNGSGTKTTGSKGGGTKKGNQGCGTSGKANCGGGSGTNEGNGGTGQGSGGNGGTRPAPAGGGGTPPPAPAPAPPAGGGGGGPETPPPAGGGGGGPETPPAEGGGGGGTPPIETPPPVLKDDPTPPAGTPRSVNTLPDVKINFVAISDKY